MTFNILIFFFLSVAISLGQVIDVTDLYTSNKYFYPNFEHLGESAGMPHSRISSLVEDHEGYLWIGTKDGGLVKYDGYGFYSYRNDPDKAFSISSNDVIFVFEDSRNMLWVGTDNALCYFNPLNRHFVKVRLPAFDSSPAKLHNITCMAEDNNGNLFLGTNTDIFAISGIDESAFFQQQNPHICLDSVCKVVGHIKLQTADSSLCGKTIKDMQIDTKGNLWVLRETDLGMIEINDSASGSGIQNKLLNSSGTFRFISDIKDGFNIDIDQTGIVWVNAVEYLYQIVAKANSFEISNIAYPFHPNQINSFNKNAGTGRKYWVGSYKVDIKLFDKDSKEFYPLTFETNDVNSLYENGLTCFIRTRSDVFFVGTAWGGLFKFNPAAVKSYYHPYIQDIHLYQTNNLRYVYEDSKGFLWLIAREIYKCNPHSGKIIETYTNESFNKSWSYENKLLEDDDGRIWVGAEEEGLYYLDIKYKASKDSLTVQSVSSKKVFGDCTVTDLHEDADGNIWTAVLFRDVATNMYYSELYKINPAGDIKNKYPIAQWPQISDLQRDLFINHIYSDGTGDIWLATGFGLVRLSEKSGKISNYIFSESDVLTLNQNKVLSICPDPYAPDNYLWIGTDGMGLLRFNIYDGVFDHVVEAKEIPGNHIASIMADDLRNLWAATDQGLARLTIDKKGGTILNVHSFDKSDGLITNDFTYYYGHNAVKTIDGGLIFTGPKGFQIIQPKNIHPDPNVDPPPLHITDFLVNYNPADFGQAGSPLDKPISLTKSITLAHDQNTLGFELTTPDFKSPGRVAYAFMLENYDKDWVNNGNDRTIRYTKLPPGEYLLNLKVEHGDGLWSNSTAALHIQILNPWWLSLWAYILYFLLVLALAWWIYRFQTNRQKLKLSSTLNKLEAEKLKELDAMKSDFFANISHELRTPLTLISVPVDNMLNRIKDSANIKSLNLIKRSTHQLQHYITDILDLSKLEANKLKLKIREVDIVAYARYIVATFESRSSQKKISLIFTSFADELICYVDPEKLNSILSNLLVNAINYTPAGGRIDFSISICDGKKFEHCSRSGGCAIISVKDTGIGIAKDKLPFIFDRYYRVEDKLSEKVSGTGLGLTLVKELVQLHKGNIDVMSKEGKYTRFVIKFPLGIDHIKPDNLVDASRYEISDEFENYDPDPTKTEKPGEALPVDSNAKIVLVIEDNETMRSIIRQGLSADYQVLEAADGEEGEQMAIETSPDLIICDVMMPRKSGFEVSEGLKSNEITSHIPIILLTGRADISDRMTGLETGVDAYLVKPFNAGELKLQIKNLLEQREKLKLKYSSQTILSVVESETKSIDEVFLEKVTRIINNNISDEKFNVQSLLLELGMSRTQLHRKLKVLVNQSANELIQNIRMQKASEMLKNKTASISEISFRVGFTNPSYFARAFKQHFGHTPSEHVGEG